MPMDPATPMETTPLDSGNRAAALTSHAAGGESLFEGKSCVPLDGHSPADASAGRRHGGCSVVWTCKGGCSFYDSNCGCSDDLDEWVSAETPGTSTLLMPCSLTARTADETFSVAFASSGFDEFLFATGDESKRAALLPTPTSSLLRDT